MNALFNTFINAADTTLWAAFWLICWELAVLFILRFFHNAKDEIDED